MRGKSIEREYFATAAVARRVRHAHSSRSHRPRRVAAGATIACRCSCRGGRMSWRDAMCERRGQTAACNAVEAFFRSHGLTDDAQVRPMFSPERFARMTSGVPQVERFIADGETMRWGGGEWTALETNGHAEGHLCLSNPAARVLISGDQVLPTISSNISFMVSQQRSESARLVSVIVAATARVVGGHAGAAVARRAVPRAAAAHRRSHRPSRGAARQSLRRCVRAEDRGRAAAD